MKYNSPDNIGTLLKKVDKRLERLERSTSSVLHGTSSGGGSSGISGYIAYTNVVNAFTQDQYLVGKLVGVNIVGNTFLTNYKHLFDANPTLRVLGSGRLDWGDGGTSAVDTNLYRSSANALKTDDSFIVGSNLVVDGSVTDSGGDHISNYSIGTIEVFGHSGVYGGSSDGNRGTDQRLGALLGADAYNRSRGGARLSWMELSIQEVGGWAHIYRHIAPEPTGGSTTNKYMLSNRDLVALWFGANDLGQLGPGATNLEPMLTSLEAVISRSRAAMVFEEDNGTVTYPTGSWFNYGAGEVEKGGSNLLYASGGSYQAASSGSVRVVTPSDFQGGTIALAFLCATNGSGALFNFTVNGVAAGSLDTRDKNAHDYGTPVDTGTNLNPNTVIKRFKNLAPGTNTIVATTAAGSFPAFDCWWVEANPPPIVVLVGGWDTSSAVPLFQFFELGGFPYVPVAGDIDDMDDLLEGVCDTFDEDVLFVRVNAAINRLPKYFSVDHIHLSDRGHAVIARLIADAVQDRVRSRAAHAEGSGQQSYISHAPGTTDRNIIQAQQTNVVPLTLRGRKAGDQFVSLLRLDGYGSYSFSEWGRDLGTQTDARIGITNEDNIFATGSYDGDLIIKADAGSIALAASSSADLIVSSGGGNVKSIRSIETTRGFVSTVNSSYPFVQRKTADQTPHWVMGQEGQMFWGPGGSSGSDTSLYRSSASMLRMGNSLTIDGDLIVSGNFGSSGVNETYTATATGFITAFQHKRIAEAFPIWKEAAGILGWGSGSSDTDVHLYRQSAGELTITGGLTLNGGASSGIVSAATGFASAFQHKRAIDSYPLWAEYAGIVGWGSGSSPIDLNMYRSAAGELTLSGSLIVAGGSSSGITSTATGFSAAFQHKRVADSYPIWKEYAGILGWGSGSSDVDVGLFRLSAGELKITGGLTLEGGSSGIIATAAGFSTAFQHKRATDTYPIWSEFGGILGWASGSSSADVLLYRSAANELALAPGDHLFTDAPTSSGHVATKGYVDVPESLTLVSGGVGFFTGWSDFGPPYSSAAYYKNASRVFLVGLVKNNGTGTGSIFTLPSGYRPPNSVVFRVPIFASTGDVIVSSGGVVTDLTFNANSKGFTSLDGISFRIA